MSITPIILTEDDKQTCITFHGICARKGYAEAGTVARIRRAGTVQHTIEYPVTIKDDTACIEWDDLIHQQPPGRYIVDILEPDGDGWQKLGFIQLQLHPGKWRAEVNDY
ncbi:MAG: hypothetical protein D8H94_15440 [Cardiobacterium sp.]|nr:MAG: hypothetical protein D8H94_15440 [Cardiobacterium sp.]